MIFFVLSLFLGCLFLIRNRKIIAFATIFPLFLTFFLYQIFGAFFFSHKNDYFVNFLLLFCWGGYFLFWFFLFLFLCRYNYLGLFLHSLIMSSLSFFKIFPPIHPFILLYPSLNILLPCTSIPILNCFLLFIISGLLFLSKKIIKGILLASGVTLVVFSTNLFTKPSKENIPPLRIMVIQVGLYFDKGGNTNNLFSDILSFIHKNPNIDLIVFSESPLLSFKTHYNKTFSENLLKKIKQYRLTERYHLFLNFSGYKEINNVVTVYRHKNREIINQKVALIPFIEKEGMLNRKQPMFSDYFFIDERRKNSELEIKNRLIKTNICYDAFFPPLHRNDNFMSVIQSSYNQLNYGKGYNELLTKGSVLAKFSVGLHSKYVINIQDHGGTVVLDEKWKTDDSIFNLSKETPFFLIELK